MPVDRLRAGRLRAAAAGWGMAVVRGRSMLPTLRPGDRLLLHYAAAPEAGRIAVVRLPGGVVAVKRLGARVAEGWWLERDNPREGVDSWSVGAVPDDAVLALATARVWPRPRRL